MKKISLIAIICCMLFSIASFSAIKSGITVTGVDHIKLTEALLVLEENGLASFGEGKSEEHKISYKSNGLQIVCIVPFFLKNWRMAGSIPSFCKILTN